MKPPEGTPSTTDVRTAASRYADGEGEGWLGRWPSYSPGERLALKDALASQSGLPREHRQRRYYRELMTVALHAYDLRMEARQRSQDTVRQVAG